jgi:hypothetical protein
VTTGLDEMPSAISSPRTRARISRDFHRALTRAPPARGCDAAFDLEREALAREIFANEFAELGASSTSSTPTARADVVGGISMSSIDPGDP